MKIKESAEELGCRHSSQISKNILCTVFSIPQPPTPDHLGWKEIPQTSLWVASRVLIGLLHSVFRKIFMPAGCGSGIIGYRAYKIEVRHI